MKRTLTLKREALTELTTSDLARIAGAADPSLSCPVKNCLATVGETFSINCSEYSCRCTADGC